MSTLRALIMHMYIHWMYKLYIPSSFLFLYFPLYITSWIYYVYLTWFNAQLRLTLPIVHQTNNPLTILCMNLVMPRVTTYGFIHWCFFFLFSRWYLIVLYILYCRVIYGVDKRRDINEIILNIYCGFFFRFLSFFFCFLIFFVLLFLKKMSHICDFRQGRNFIMTK